MVASFADQIAEWRSAGNPQIQVEQECSAVRKPRVALIPGPG
jgi:hypothetical protein